MYICNCDYIHAIFNGLVFIIGFVLAIRKPDYYMLLLTTGPKHAMLYNKHNTTTTDCSLDHRETAPQTYPARPTRRTNAPTTHSHCHCCCPVQPCCCCRRASTCNDGQRRRHRPPANRAAYSRPSGRCRARAAPACPDTGPLRGACRPLTT